MSHFSCVFSENVFLSSTNTLFESISDQENISKYLTQNSKLIFAIKRTKTDKHVAKTFKAFGNVIEICIKI